MQPASPNYNLDCYTNKGSISAAMELGLAPEPYLLTGVPVLSTRNCKNIVKTKLHKYNPPYFFKIPLNVTGQLRLQESIYRRGLGTIDVNLRYKLRTRPVIIAILIPCP